MSEYVVRPLEPDSWDGFAGLVERHNGVFRWLLVHVVPHHER